MVMDGGLLRGLGGKFIKECMEVDFVRRDIEDEEVVKKLWEESDKLIEKMEKVFVLRRVREKKEKEEREKVEEIESLVEIIKKGKVK